MNIRSLVIIGVIAIVVVSLVAFLFFREIVKESAPVPVPTTEAVKAEPAAQAGYAIPVNTVPTVSQIEESIKKDKEKRKAVNDFIAKIEAEKAKTREEVRAEAQKAEREAVTMPESKKNETVNLPEQKPVKNPTREERERMRANGIIAY